MIDPGILVVDESSDTVDVVKRIFGHFRVTVESVCPAVALDRLKTGNNGTMIINLNLEGMSGAELANKARKQFPTLNIVMFACRTPVQVLSLIFDGRVVEVSGIPTKS